MSYKNQILALVEDLTANFSSPKRLAVIGSMSFSNPNTEGVCRSIGYYLAAFEDLIVITGGVSGIPETISRSLWNNRKTVSTGGASVFHMQPQGFDPWDYGENITAGRTMEERRHILARVAPVYLLLEGGFGAEQESQIALSCGALLIPVGFTGGAARSLFDRFNAVAMKSLPENQRQAWKTLDTYLHNREAIAAAVATLVAGAMKRAEQTSFDG